MNEGVVLMFGTQVGYDALEVIAYAKWEEKQETHPHYALFSHEVISGFSHILFIFICSRRCGCESV